MKTNILVGDKWSGSSRSTDQSSGKKPNAWISLASRLRYTWLLVLLTAIPVYLNAQTITTDKVDYEPGDQVLASGKGWRPNEQIDLVLTELVYHNPGATLMVTADADGKFSQNIYTLEEADRGAFFHVKATGRASGHISTITFNDDGGDYALDFSAYDPPHYKKWSYTQFIATYGESGLPEGAQPSPLEDPSYEDPGSTDHGKTSESLSPQGLGLGQIVPFELWIRVDKSLPCANDKIYVTAEWHAETTSGGAFGYDKNLGAVAAFVCNSPDPSYIDSGTPASVSNLTWRLVNDKTHEPSADPAKNNTIQATIEVTGLDGEDEVPVEIWVVLQNTIAQNVSGIVQSSLYSAETTGTCAPPEDKTTINTGGQTVPLNNIGEFFTTNVDVSITKTDRGSDIVHLGDNITYDITVTNSGPTTTLTNPSVANTINVTDILDPNTSYVSHSITDSGGAGWTFSQNGGTLTFLTDFLDIGETATITVVVQVNASAPHTGVGGEGTCSPEDASDLCNLVSVTTISDDINSNNNSDSEPTGVECVDLTVNATPVNVTCYGESNGSVTVVASGGFEPYTYTLGLVSNTTGLFSGLGASTTPYLVSVVDHAGCTGQTSFTITQPDPITLVTSSTNVTCNGGENGTLTIDSFSGTGTPVFSLKKDEGSFVVKTEAEIEGGSYGPGTYVIKIAYPGGNGTIGACEFTQNELITQPDPITLVTSSTNVICNGEENGTLTIESFSGTGTPVISLKIDEGSFVVKSEAEIEGGSYGPGTYVIKIAYPDGNGTAGACYTTNELTIIEPAILACNIVTPTYTKPICGEHQNNAINATVMGGTGAYTYVWTIEADNPSDAANWYVWEGAGTGYIKFAAGNYPATIKLEVTDENGCKTYCEYDMYGCSDEYYCTYTQGFYGNEGGKACSPEGPGASAFDMMTSVLPSGSVRFGLGDIAFELFATDITNSNIFNMLPGGSTPQPLLGFATYGDGVTKAGWAYVPIDTKAPQLGRIKNALLAQAMVLYFNLGQNSQFNLGNLQITGPYLITADAEECGVRRAVPYQDIYTIIPENVIDLLLSEYGAGNATVANLLDLANRMLGQDPELVTITPNGPKIKFNYGTVTAADLTQALDAINRGFDECRVFVEFSEFNPVSAQSKSGYQPKFAGTIDMNEAAMEVDIMAVRAIAYPNPFNEKVNIEFEVGANTSATVEVYTLTGVKVKTLYDGDVSAYTLYSFEFTDTSTSGNMYLYKISTPMGVRTGKIFYSPEVIR